MITAELERVVEEPIDLTPPLEFKVFRPCETGKHEECAKQTREHQCCCQCHNNVWDLNEEDCNEEQEETF
jgi:hypothetical protein